MNYASLAVAFNVSWIKASQNRVTSYHDAYTLEGIAIPGVV